MNGRGRRRPRGCLTDLGKRAPAPANSFVFWLLFLILQCYKFVGQAFSLLRASARPAGNTGPGVLLFGSGQPGSDRVFNNVSFYALELRSAADDVIVRLRLPEWLSGQAQQAIAFSSRNALQSSASTGMGVELHGDADLNFPVGARREIRATITIPLILPPSTVTTTAARLRLANSIPRRKSSTACRDERMPFRAKP